MRYLFELTVQLYEVSVIVRMLIRNKEIKLQLIHLKILLRVDRRIPHMKNMDAVCDLLYHIKYQVLK